MLLWTPAATGSPRQRCLAPMVSSANLQIRRCMMALSWVQLLVWARGSTHQRFGQLFRRACGAKGQAGWCRKHAWCSTYMTGDPPAAVLECISTTHRRFDRSGTARWPRGAGTGRAGWPLSGGGAKQRERDVGLCVCKLEEHGLETCCHAMPSRNHARAV